MGLFDFIRKGSSCKCRKSEMTQEHGGFVNPGQNTICQSIGNRMQIVSRTIEKCSDNSGKTRPVFES